MFWGFFRFIQVLFIHIGIQSFEAQSLLNLDNHNT